MDASGSSNTTDPIHAPIHADSSWENARQTAGQLGTSLPTGTPRYQDYGPVAAEYAARFHNELETKPFDRKMLELLIEKTAALGPICDLGCGPGQIARYLRNRGAEACGIDLAAEMVAEAARLNPAIPFRQGDMRNLAGEADASLGGIAAFYCVIHLTRDELPRALSEMRRVLRPGGVALVTFHIGDETFHLNEWFGKPAHLDFHFYRTAEMRERMAAAGLTVEEAVERDPYPPEVEHQTRRAYIFARR
jgi:SAM-dependent methyltransferase